MQNGFTGVGAARYAWDCAPTQQLAAAIAKGPAPRIVTASDVATKPVVTPN